MAGPVAAMVARRREDRVDLRPGRIPAGPPSQNGRRGPERGRGGIFSRAPRGGGGEGPEIEIGGEFTPLALAWSAEGDRLAITGQPAPRQRGPDWAPESLWPRLRIADPVPQIYLAAATGGTARQLSRAPSGCAGEAAWMLDGKALIAACGDGMALIATQEGTAKPLTKDVGRYESPVVSPDGGRIAYLFTDRKPQTYTVRKLWVMNADGSRPRTLSGSLDRDATAPQWSSESRTVY